MEAAESGGATFDRRSVARERLDGGRVESAAQRRRVQGAAGRHLASADDGDGGLDFRAAAHGHARAPDAFVLPRQNTMLEFVEFLWGCVPFNSDIDTKDPHSTEWKELTIENRTGPGRVDVDIVKEAPLVIKARSKDPALVLRAANYLADHCGGEILNEPRI